MEDLETIKLAQETVEFFRENEDGYFAMAEDNCTWRPLKYVAYDLEVAALDALFEYGAIGDKPMTFEQLKLVHQVSREAALIIDRNELIQTLTGRLAIASALNNHGGQGNAFNPN